MDGLRVRTRVKLSVIINNATLPRVSSLFFPDRSKRRQMIRNAISLLAISSTLRRETKKRIFFLRKKIWKAIGRGRISNSGGARRRFRVLHNPENERKQIRGHFHADRGHLSFRAAEKHGWLGGG